MTTLAEWSGLLSQIDPKNSNHPWICKDQSGRYHIPSPNSPLKKVSLKEIFQYSQNLLNRPINIADLEHAVTIAKQVKTLSDRSVEKHTKATGMLAAIHRLFWRLFFDKTKQAVSMYKYMKGVVNHKLFETSLKMIYLKTVDHNQAMTVAKYSSEGINYVVKEKLTELEIDLSAFNTKDLRENEYKRLEKLELEMFHFFTLKELFS